MGESYVNTAVTNAKKKRKKAESSLHLSVGQGRGFGNARLPGPFQSSISGLSLELRGGREVGGASVLRGRELPVLRFPKEVGRSPLSGRAEGKPAPPRRGALLAITGAWPWVVGVMPHNNVVATPGLQTQCPKAAAQILRCSTTEKNLCDPKSQPTLALEPFRRETVGHL